MQIRKELQKIEDVRRSFRATFQRFGKKHGKSSGKTLLLTDIYPIDRQSSGYQDTGPKVTDHLWFNLTKQFEALNLIRNDQVIFDARVKEYRKGSIKRGIPVTYDYKLSHPYKIQKIQVLSTLNYSPIHQNKTTRENILF